MVDVYDGPFGVYASPVGGVVNAAAKADIATLLTTLMSLMSVTMDLANDTYTVDQGVSAPHPDFDQIPLHIREKFAVEIIAINNAVDAAAVA